MKLAVSNIAWSRENAENILPGLRDRSVQGLVIAPTLVWDSAPLPSSKEIKEFGNVVEAEGLVVSSLQSLVFGKSDCQLFGSTNEQQNLAEHLKRQAELAGRLGAKSLIFGSPGLRKSTETKKVKIDGAVRIFTQVAEAAESENTVLCIEPLSGYGNEFVTTTTEGIELVQQIDHPGFGLHLDSAAIAGANEDPFNAIDLSIKTTGIISFDASAPELMPPSQDITVPHRDMARALWQADYQGFISLEMKGPQTPNAIFSELDMIREQYEL